jgi:hypothetical protein
MGLQATLNTNPGKSRTRQGSLVSSAHQRLAVNLAVIGSVCAVFSGSLGISGRKLIDPPTAE